MAADQSADYRGLQELPVRGCLKAFFLRFFEAFLRFFSALGPVVVLIQVAVSSGAFHGKENRRPDNGPASVVRKARDVDQVSCLADSLFVTKDEVKLPLEHQSELLLVGMHVERRAFLVRFGHDSRLHKFANGRLHELLWVCRSAILLHLGNLVKSHFSPSYCRGRFCIPHYCKAGRLSTLTDAQTRC